MLQQGILTEYAVYYNMVETL